MDDHCVGSKGVENAKTEGISSRCEYGWSGLSIMPDENFQNDISFRRYVLDEV